MTDQTLQPEAQNTAENNTSPAAEKLFAGKYHSVDALEQGYRELSRLVREKTPEVPETYQLDLSEFQAEGAEAPSLEHDVLWQTVSPAMREAGMSNKQAEAVTKAFIHFQQQQAAEEQKALKAMGVEGQHMVHHVRRFVDSTFGAEEKAIAHQLAATVDGVKFLHKVAQMAGEKPIPTGSAAGGIDVASLKEKAKAMMSDPELKYNRQKQEAYNNLWKDITSLSS